MKRAWRLPVSTDHVYRLSQQYVCPNQDCNLRLLGYHWPWHLFVLKKSFPLNGQYLLPQMEWVIFNCVRKVSPHGLSWRISTLPVEGERNGSSPSPRSECHRIPLLLSQIQQFITYCYMTWVEFQNNDIILLVNSVQFYSYFLRECLPMLFGHNPGLPILNFFFLI